MGSHVTLEPNPHFYGEAPKIQRIIVRIIQNTGTLEANLRSGTIHKISSLGLSFDQALALEKRVAQEKSPFQVLFKPSLIYEHIDLNMDHPALKDLRVRRALLYGVNREELVQSLFEGRQPVAHHNFAKIDPWYTEDPTKISLYPFSRRQAQRLLDEAGWKLNEADGLRYKDNKKLSLQFMTTAGNKTRETVQTFLQSQWRSLGIEVVIRNEPARVFFGETTRKRDFGAMAMFAWISAPENSPRSQLSCKSVPRAENSWSGQNYTGFCDKRMDELIDLVETEFDPKKRAALAHEILGIYTREVPVLPLYFRSDIAVIPQGLKNFELAGHMYPETHQVERWTF
jgi:peptide/nickel transport system substrate-binding protein